MNINNRYKMKVIKSMTIRSLMKSYGSAEFFGLLSL